MIETTPCTFKIRKDGYSTTYKGRFLDGTWNKVGDIIVGLACDTDGKIFAVFCEDITLWLDETEQPKDD